MAEKKDAYATLEINKSASADEIKQAYRRLAKKYHPDLNHEPGAADKFKEVQEAYDVLSDADKKAKYDQFGWPGVDPQAPGAGGFNGQGGFGNFGDFGDIGDIFSQFFGGGRRSSNTGPTRSRGADVESSIRITFMESVKGVTKTIPLSYYKLCHNCNGSGAQSPNDVETCSRCRGTGRVRVTQQSLFGQVVSERACPDCNGIGKRIRNKCSSCNGTGYEKVKENYELHIPAGIGNGRQLRLQGKGQPGRLGGECGDLYLEVLVESSSVFTREANSNNIHIEFPISPLDAILGASIEVPTVYGIEKINIPAGSQNGDTIRIRNRGFKAVNANSYGDEIVHLVIKMPTSLSREEKAMYDAIRNVEIKNKNRPSEAYTEKAKRTYKL